MAGSHKLLIDKWMDGWANLEPMDQQMGMVHSWCAHLLTVTSHHCIVTATLCQVAAELAMARSHPLKPCILPAHNVGIRPENLDMSENFREIMGVRRVKDTKNTRKRLWVVL